MKIINKIIILVFFLVVMSMVALLLFSYYTTSRDVINSELASKEILARQLMQSIDRDIYERLVDVQTISVNKTWQEFLVENLDSDYVKVELSAISLNSGPWENLAILDTNLNTRISLVSFDIDDNIKHIAEQSLNGAYAYSDVYEVSPDKFIMSFSSPIRDNRKQGRPIIGVLVGLYPFDVINDNLLILDYHRVALFNGNGDIIASGEERFKTFFMDISANRREMLSSLQFNENNYQSSLYYQDKAILLKTPQQGYLDFHGKNWQLVIEIPQQEISAKVISGMWVLTLLLLPLIVLIALIFSYALYLFIIKPINEMSVVAQQIANGKYNKRLPIKSNDEFGKLAGNFNAMVDRLVKAKQNVEKIVETRTAELEKINKFLVDRELKIKELKEDRIKQCEPRKKS